MSSKDKLTVTISPASFVYLAVVAAAVAAVWYLSGVVIIVVASVIFAAGLNPSVKRLEKIKFPRWLAVSVIYVMVFSILGYLIFLIAPTISEQANDIFKNFPAHRARVGASLDSQPLLQEAFDRVTDSVRSRPEILANQVGAAATGIIGSLFGFITFLVLTFYFLMSGREISSAMVKYVPSRKSQKEIIAIGKESSVKLGHWIRSQVIMSIIVFLTTYLVLSILGVEFSLSLALFAGLLQFVPFVGPLLGAAPALLAALVISPLNALIYSASVLIVQMLLANVIAPQLFNKAIGVSPVVILIAALIGFSLLGPVGVILAVPIAAVVDVVFDSLGPDYVKDKIFDATKS